MRVHDLKTWPEPFRAVDAQTKRFEYRRADRPFEVGDVLRLREWDPATASYTGRECRRVISYMLSGAFGVPPGFAVMSLRALTPAESSLYRALTPPAEETEGV